MLAALTGFGHIGLIVGLGVLLAHVKVLGDLQRALLNRLAFLVASPALLFTVVSTADLGRLFSETLLVSALAIFLAGGLQLVLARAVHRAQGAEAVIGALCAAYANAGNLGLPITAAILGDMSWMAPILLLQVGLLQPLALGYLDVHAARTQNRQISWWAYPTLPLRNPITVATMLGLAVNLAGWTTPEVIATPIEMVGGMAIPAMLIAFGVSLRLDPLSSRGGSPINLWTIVLIKVLLHPLLAYLLATQVWHLGSLQVLAVSVIGALPAAQNIAVIASRYEVGRLLARDAIFISTLLSVPAIVAISALLR
ncbi:MAG: AEC family transporter [Micropruina sp.]